MALPHHLRHAASLPARPGEEEIPEGCVAVLTPDAPDVLSHVSVRARNMKVWGGAPPRASPGP